MSIKEKVGQYIKLRDHKDAAKKALDASLERVNQAMELLEGEMLKFLNESGADSIASENGTAYRRDEVSVTVADPAAYLAHLKAHDEWEEADIKANKTAIRHRLINMIDLPPGVNASVTARVGIRRASK